MFKYNFGVSDVMAKMDYGWKSLLKDYWALLQGRRLKFCWFTFLRACASWFTFVVTFFLGLIIDFFTGYSQGDSLSLFYIYFAVIAVLSILEVWLRFYAKVPMQNIGAQLRQEVRVKAMSNLMDLELKWHEKEETGSLIQRINAGGEGIFNGIKNFTNSGIHFLTLLSGSIVAISLLNSKYLIFALVYAIIYLVIEQHYNKQFHVWKMKLHIIKEKVSGKIQESASNLLTVKSLGLKDSIKQRTVDYEKKYYDTWIKTRDISKRKLQSVKIFSGLMYSLFILILGLDVAGGLITVGMILVFASYYMRLKDALHEYSRHITDFLNIKAAIGRFMTIFRENIIDEESKIVVKKWKNIEFKNVSFKYKHKMVLSNFSLMINKGDKIGFAGQSGCGKSTFVKLLLGLYEPTSGDILIDGVSLKDIKHTSITNIVGVVLQDTEVFNMSLMNNVTITSKKNDFKKLYKVLKIAQLEVLVSKLKSGLNSLIGEKGYKVSGGERQRIGIARALYKDTDVIILDEATSSLDSKTEQKIQTKLDKLDKTMLIVAHRLSTLRNVDRIIIMHNAKIVEQGSYEELIKKKGKFYRMNKLQK